MPKLNSYVHNLLNQNNGRIVVNKEFAKWQGEIERRIWFPDTCRDDYSDSTGAEIFKVAKEHVKTYRKLTNAPAWITLTHPLYVFLTHGEELKKEIIIDDANKYASNLMDLLTAGIPREKANIILIETAYHYAAATSRMLEQGLVDDVFFTLHDSGYMMNTEEFSTNPTYFCAGSYSNLCFRQTLKEIMERVEHDRVNVISGLVIETPKSVNGLFPESIKLADNTHVNSITLKELYQKLGMS